MTGSSPNIQGTPVQEAPQGDLIKYLRLIWKHRAWVFVATFTATFGMGLYYSYLPDVYMAQVKILVERPNAGMKFYEEKFMALLSEQDADYYGTQISVLTGREIVNKVNEELKVEPGSYRLKAQRVPNTRIISLDVWHPNSELPAQIANKFAEIFIRENAQDNSFLPQQILKLLPENIELATGSSTAFVRSLPTVNNDVMVQDLRSEKMRIEAHLRELSERYKPGHPAIQSIHQRLADLDAQMMARTNDVLGSLKASLSGEFRITNVRVFESALPSSVPLKPNMLRGLLLGFLGGFFLSAVCVVTIETVNPKVAKQEDLLLPGFPPFLGALPILHGMDKKNFNTLDFFQSNKVLNDAAANLRTRLLFLAHPEKQKSFLITGVLPGEGKTFSAIFLSLSLAMLGQKVLLVDADLREPAVHRYLGLENQKGLSDFLRTPVVLRDILREVPGSALKVVTAGGFLKESSALLSTSAATQFLEQAAANFDRIVIDSPPGLYIPDAVLFSEHVENVIVLCKADKTPQKDLSHLIEKLNLVNRHIIGILLNGADFKSDRTYKLYSRYYQKR